MASVPVGQSKDCITILLWPECQLARVKIVSLSYCGQCARVKIILLDTVVASVPVGQTISAQNVSRRSKTLGLTVFRLFRLFPYGCGQISKLKINYFRI